MTNNSGWKNTVKISLIKCKLALKQNKNTHLTGSLK